MVQQCKLRDSPVGHYLQSRQERSLHVTRESATRVDCSGIYGVTCTVSNPGTHPPNLLLEYERQIKNLHPKLIKLYNIKDAATELCSKRGAILKHGTDRTGPTH